MEYLRLALNNSVFPFKYSQRVDSALFAPLDTTNRTPAAFAGSSGNIDWNLPQVSHVENFLPTERGYIAVTYRQKVQPYKGTDPNLYWESMYLNPTFNFDFGSGGWSVGQITKYTSSRFLYALKLTPPISGFYYFPDSEESFTLAVGETIYFRVVFGNATPSTAAILLPSGATVDLGSVSGSYTATVAGAHRLGIRTATTATVYLAEIYASKLANLSAPVTGAVKYKGLGNTRFALFSGNLVYTNTTTPESWVAAPAHTLIAPIQWATQATVNGRHFVNFKGTTNTLIESGVGTVPRSFSSIAGFSTYLVGVDSQKVYWSLPTNPTDFTSYGAGSGIPSGIIGDIIHVVSLSNGLIIFGRENAVSATYTGIPTAPFRFAVIPGAGGISSASQVDATEQGSIAIAYTNRGLQLLSLTSAQAIPGISDALNSYVVKYPVASAYGEVEELRTKATYGIQNDNPIVADLVVACKAIAERYFVVSFRSSDSAYFQHCFVLDLHLQRWGRLRFDHVQALDLAFGVYSTSSTENPHAGYNLKLVHPSGAIYTVTTETDAESNWNPYGYHLAITGIKATRSNRLVFQECEVSSLLPFTATPTLHIQPAAGGKSYSASQQFTYSDVSMPTVNFYGRCAATTADIHLRLAGDITDISIGFTRSGD